MSDQLYPSDMTDREWEYIKDLIPAAKPGGRKRVTDMRQTLNAIFYLKRTGCAWRYLPLEYPPWQTVYGYFRKWRLDKTWQHIRALQSSTPNQSKRLTAAEPNAALTLVRKLLAANDISWLIH